MRRVTEDIIKRAKSPWEIYSRDPTLIEQEKEEYLSRFKPVEYKNVEYYVIQQQVIILYRKAVEELSGVKCSNVHTVIVTDTTGKEYRFDYLYSREERIGQTLTLNEQIVIIVNRNYKSYYENYVSKCTFKRHVDRELWKEVKYYLPKVEKTFETTDGDFVIIIKKPHAKVYPLTSILEYFDGRLAPEYVASIMTRLYRIAIYCNLRGFSHNAITVENLWFSPGRFTNPGEHFTVEDLRVVGLYDGWFFTTNNSEELTGYPNEVIKGLPKKIKSILPKDVQTYHYGTYKIDMLSIKQVGRELLGDITGTNFENVPKPFVEWLNNSDVATNAYEEFVAWEKVRDASFGEHKFVEIYLNKLM